MYVREEGSKENFAKYEAVIISVLVPKKQLPSFETEIIQTIPELVKDVIKWCRCTNEKLKMETAGCRHQYKL